MLSLIRNLSNVMKNEKTFNEVMNQLFHIWEECIIDGLDDFHYASGKTPLHLIDPYMD